MHIRKATKSDMAGILALVQELATYEREPEAVTATLADYERDFDAGIFQAHVVEDEGRIVGMMLYYMTYSTWKGRMLYLEDFVVTEAYRGKGIGKLLFDTLIEEAKAQGARLLKWQVLEWNEPAINFYRKYNAIIDTEWHNGKIIF